MKILIDVMDFTTYPSKEEHKRLIDEITRFIEHNVHNGNIEKYRDTNLVIGIENNKETRYD